MHLGNGAITPECAVLTASIAAAGLGFAAASARRLPVVRGQWLAAGAYGAAIFAAQMINVQLLPYSSGHLVGGVLLAVALGPGRGALTMAIVLALQAILLGDGGLAALGANIVNMALIPAAVVALGKSWQGAQASPLHAALQAALAVMLAAALIVVEVAVARPGFDEVPLAAFAGQMLFAHAIIAVAEGLVTGVLVYALLRLRTRYAHSETYPGIAAGALAIALIALVPLSSPLPDGYEAAVERSGWESLLAETTNLALWQAQASESIAAVVTSQWLLAFFATLVAAVCCASVGWIWRVDLGRQQLATKR